MIKLIKKILILSLVLLSMSTLVSCSKENELKNDDYHVVTNVYTSNEETYMEVKFQSMVDEDIEDVKLLIYFNMIKFDEKVLVYEKDFDLIKGKQIIEKDTVLITLDEKYELVSFVEGESPVTNFETIVEVYDGR